MEPMIIKSSSSSTTTVVVENSFDSLFENICNTVSDFNKVCIVSDEKVAGIYLSSVSECMKDKKVISFVVNEGEQSKDISVFLQIQKFLYDNNFNRNDLLIALGGGVVGDLTGFVAATYKRGVPFVQIPTSLLAMTDSSIGGKTAVDFEGCKNIIGAFVSPKLVYVNTKVLDTLDLREFYCGMAEIMKAGLIVDSKFYVWLIDNNYEICEHQDEFMAEMISHAQTIKKNIVEKDPFENGNRALLNFGHTIGHGIEAAFAGEYKHGEAVSLGMVVASYISWKLNYIQMEDYYEIRDMFVLYHLPISVSVDKTIEILSFISKDKKNKDEHIRMILLKRVGKAFIEEDVSKDLIKEALQEICFDDFD